MVRGEYIIQLQGKEIIIPNTIVAEGAELLLGELFQSVALDTMYLGLCNQVPDNDDVLSDVITEPSIGTNGYARNQLLRNSTDFPDIDSVNNESFVTSKQVTFTASGGAFDAEFSRIFLCNVASGAGTLFSYSAAMALPITLADGDSFPVQYRFYLR